MLFFFFLETGPVWFPYSLNWLEGTSFLVHELCQSIILGPWTLKISFQVHQLWVNIIWSTFLLFPSFSGWKYPRYLKGYIFLINFYKYLYNIFLMNFLNIIWPSILSLNFVTCKKRSLFNFLLLKKSSLFYFKIL